MDIKNLVRRTETCSKNRKLDEATSRKLTPSEQNLRELCLDYEKVKERIAVKKNAIKNLSHINILNAGPCSWNQQLRKDSDLVLVKSRARLWE